MRFLGGLAPGRCLLASLGWLLLGLGWLGRAAGASPLEFPPEVALPLRVETGLFIVAVESIADAEGAATAVVDWRLAWTDPRLACEASADVRRELSDEQARERLTRMWTPHIQLANLATAPEVSDEDLNLYPEGRVEWIRRLRATFKNLYDHTSFPLDRQLLRFAIASPLYTQNQVSLQSDVGLQEFSGHADLALEGWRFGRLRFVPSSVTRWNGTVHAQIEARMPVHRLPTPYLSSIFLPIAAVLLVPLLALWLNRWRDHSFVVEPFELMNVCTGGLFATIALTLAIYSVYPFLSSGQNMVGRLFTLNYLLLGLSMLTILMLFKTQLSDRPWFSPYVALEAYRFLCWATPLMTLVLAGAIFVWAWP